MGSRNTKHSLFGSIDWLTLVLYAIMVIFGVISIYAASYDFDNASMFDFSEFSGKQITWIGLSLILGLVILLIDSRMYETYAYPMYIGMVLLLVVTIFIAPDINGSHSWIVLGPMSLQPAEFAKFATALALAKIFSEYNFSLNNVSNYIKVLSVIFIPILLILAQKETGSALVYLSLFFVLYREGMSGIILFAALMAVVIFVVAVKFATNTIMGITTGEFSVFIIIMLTMMLMLSLYCKRQNISRNVIIGFVVSGIIIALLSAFDINIHGRLYFITILSIACIYCLLEFIKLKSNKLITTIATTM